MNITNLPPLSLYIHYPWCVKKCPYCDFNSHAVRDPIPESNYIDALLADLEQELPSIWGRQLTSIFIGGGTPSLISVKGMDYLLAGIRARLPFLADTEVTMEANPGTLEADKFKGFFDAGVNRLSIGVQSFNDKFLKTLGRIHSSDQAKLAFETARNSGFENINLDLMYALPGQTIDQAMDDLQTAIRLSPEHLSWYQMTLEPNTAFYQSPPPQMPSDDRLADISERGLSLLSESNFRRYEVSAFSRAGKFPAWHNTNYWQFGDYLGIGAGAHGKITRADTQQITRTSKKRNPKDYMNKQMDFVSRQQILTPQQLPFEFMLNALRLKDGVNQASFYETTGLLFSQIEPVVQKLVKLGLLNTDAELICTTETGYRFLNEVLTEFADDNFPELANHQTIPIKNLS